MKLTVPIQIIDLHDDGFHPLVEVVVYGQYYKVVLDTGASRTAFDHATLLQANAKANILSTERLSTGLGTNNMSSGIITLTDFYIGALHIPNVEVAVLDLSNINLAYQQLNYPQILGVIGGDILMKHKAIIDYGKQILTLQLSKNIK